MLKRKRVYAVLGAVGALALLLGGLGGVSVVSAQEATPETGDPPAEPMRGRGPGSFGFDRIDWASFDTAGETLGLTPEELFSELHAGNSLEDVAAQQGVEVEAVHEALRAMHDEAMRTRIEQAVEDGELGQEEADWRLEGLENGYMSGRGFHGGMEGGRGRPGPGGDPDRGGDPQSGE